MLAAWLSAWFACLLHEVGLGSDLPAVCSIALVFLAAFCLGQDFCSWGGTWGLMLVSGAGVRSAFTLKLRVLLRLTWPADCVMEGVMLVLAPALGMVNVDVWVRVRVVN